jgi:hydroxypyruvate reductase
MTALTRPADPRALLADLYWAAVTAAAPGPALRTALTRHTPDSDRPVHILALGKAALPMAQAAVAVLAERGTEPAGGLLVVPEPATSPHPRLTVAVGDHPQPGAGSFAAAGRLEDAVHAVRPNDEVWILLSGGTTSLIGAPLPGLRPDDLTALYRLLLGSGLDITAMNRIRKRFTRWAGGRLAAALYPAHVKNFTISDVIGDDLPSIGSGPAVPDTSSAADVRTALGSAGLWERVPMGLREHLEAVIRGTAPETPKPNHPAFQNTETILIASNRLALEAAALRARAFGLEAHILDTALSGEAAEVGRRLASKLLEYDATNFMAAQAGTMNKDTILVWGGETTVTLTPDAGLGGRSQELALAAAQVLDEAARRLGAAVVGGATLLAAGTDGRDGPTDAAGGFADRDTWAAIRRAGRDPTRDLRSHHGYDALAAAGALFKTGMTGTNVMDLVLGLTPGG